MVMKPLNCFVFVVGAWRVNTWCIFVFNLKDFNQQTNIHATIKNQKRK